MNHDIISVRGAKEHNLQNVNVDIPRNKLVVITGPSGSGKSSLAFDTIYAEGQRRYVESLSTYARQFLELQNKPDVESITGLSPAIAIVQKTTSKNPRSTVGTVTEIYDYMRLMFTRIGVPYSPATGQPIESQSASNMVDILMDLPEGTKLYLLAPIVRGQKGEHRKELLQIKKDGYSRVKINGEIYEIDQLPTIDKNKKNDIEILVDRLVIKEDIGNRLADSVETALKISHGLLMMEIVEIDEEAAKEKKIKHKKGDVVIMSEKFSCPISGFTLPEMEPRIFSFNSPYGACKECDGLGTEMYFDPNMVVPNVTLSLSDGAIAPWTKKDSNSESTRYQQQTIDCLAKHYGFSIHTPWKDLDEDMQYVLLYGSDDDEIKFTYDDGYRRTNTKKAFEGVVCNMERRYFESESSWIREELSKFQSKSKCQSCNGYRLKKESLCVKINDLNIGEVCNKTIEEAVKWFEDLPNHLNDQHNRIGERILKELRQRLGFLYNVGLGYLTLNRESGTLSGGESQRIRLASQIGSGLSGVLYVLDEPSIGLHQCDNDRLIRTLHDLRDLGNTVIVVEHDEDTMLEADHLIDIGPGAGVHGGLIIAEGTPKQVMESEESLTGKYLNGTLSIPVPEKRRKEEENRNISIRGARSNNLNNVDVDIPLRLFTSVTGVSGSGKSSLVIQTLYKAAIKKLHGSKVTPGACDNITGLEYIDKIIEIDQSPIGRTPRSNPATYTGAFSPIRDWFAALPEAKARGYKVGRFSFNVKGGRCETCQGDGMIKIEMHFLPDVYVNCDDCNGSRYNKETLEITYNGKNISDVLNMTVSQAVIFFDKMPNIAEKLQALEEVGLGYVKLGQSATTLSGGEAQRIKLARELSKRSTGRTLYILDEPTTGLHTHDIGKLLKVLHKLVDAGNTVVVIEHNLHVIKTSDWIIDVGPYGGDKGGNIVATGTPEEVAKVEESVTAKYLREYLDVKETEEVA